MARHSARAEILVALVHALRGEQVQHGGVDAVAVEQLGAQEIEVGAGRAAVGRPGIGARERRRRFRIRGRTR